MQLPFTTEEFISAFRSYNTALGMVPVVVAYLLGLGMTALALRPTRWSSKAIALALGALWTFTGIAYHLMTFATINPAAKGFGALFILQGGLLAVAGMQSKLTFRFSGDLRSKSGMVIVLWSALGYPMAGLLFGHGYPEGPVFGLTPCPLLLLTFAMLLLSDAVPRYLLPILVMWTAVGTSAAVTLGIREDLSLAISAIVSLSFLLRSSATRCGSAQDASGVMVDAADFLPGRPRRSDRRRRNRRRDVGLEGR